MHDLENAIRDWKFRLSRKGVEPENLEELESHLRDTIDELMAVGLPEEEAFSDAVRRLGEESEIANEYRKVEKALLVDRIAISAIGAFSLYLVIQVLWLLMERAGEKSLSMLLQIHVGALTIALLGSAFFFFVGLYCLPRRFFTRNGDGALTRLIRKILTYGAPIGAGLALVGLVAGLFWSAGNRDSAWSFHLKEIGAVVILLWYIGGIYVARKGTADLKGLTLLALTGGILVHFNWFVIGGMPLTTVSVLVAFVLTIVFLTAFLAFRKQKGHVVATG